MNPIQFRADLCYMHRGQIIERVVEESGVNKTQLAKKLGKSRQWLYNLFKSEQVSFDIIIEIGKILHHDFSSDFKQLKKYIITDSHNMVEDQSAEYWRKKYIDLLEEYNQLLKNKK